MQKVDKERQLRVRIHSYQRQKKVRGKPCSWCDKPGNRVHHIVPIQFGGSYGEYNLMSACESPECDSHSRFNRLSNHWCKKHANKHEGKTLLDKTRLCKEYILDCVKRAKSERERRRLLKNQRINLMIQAAASDQATKEVIENGNVQSDIQGGSVKDGLLSEQTQEDVSGGGNQDGNRES